MFALTITDSAVISLYSLAGGDFGYYKFTHSSIQTILVITI